MSDEKFTIEQHGPEGSYALYYGRSRDRHGFNLATLNEFDFYGNTTREWIEFCLNYVNDEFKVTLPRHAPKFVCTVHRFSGCPIHDDSFESGKIGFESLEIMAECVLQRLNEEHYNVYYGDAEINYISNSLHAYTGFEIKIGKDVVARSIDNGCGETIIEYKDD